jgi:hypothetical protein
MTAVNIIKQKNAVHVLTDGASWLPTGGFGPACAKAFQLPHLNAVVASRGPRLGGVLIADFLGSCANSYDEMKLRSAEMVRGAIEFYTPIFAANTFSQKLEVVVAGWSEKSGPDAFVISAHGDNPAVSPWATHDCGSVMMAPGGASIEKAVFDALPPQVKCADDMDPARDGLSIVLAQRAARGLSDVSDLVVGAFVQLTTISLDGIATRILHRWPEDSGKDWGAPR